MSSDVRYLPPHFLLAKCCNSSFLIPRSINEIEAEGEVLLGPYTRSKHDELTLQVKGGQRRKILDAAVDDASDSTAIMKAPR